MRCEAQRKSTAAYTELVQLIYGAAMVPAQWQVFLDRLSSVCGEVRTHMFGQDQWSGDNIGFLYGGYDPAYIDSFQAYYGTLNSWAPGMLTLPLGIVHHADAMCPPDEVLGSEFYADWVQPQEDIRTGGGVVLHRDETCMFMLGGNIRHRDADALVAPFLAMVERLTPHLLQAIQISRTFGGQSLESLALGDSRATLDSAIFAINRASQVLYANASAYRLMEQGDIVSVTWNGCATISHPRTRDVLGSLWRAPPEHRSAATSHLVDAHGLGYAVKAVRLDPTQLGYSPLGMVLGRDQPFLLVTLTPHDERWRVQQLRQRYGLTAREAFVAADIARGKSVADIASEQCRSVHTVRDQLKSALSKLGVGRQAELVARWSELVS